MRLAPAELGDERENRSGVRGFTGKASQHHSGVFVQCAGETGASEKLYRVLVVVRRSARSDLFESDGEFVGIE
jgi:hypothetical protein